MDSNGNKKRVLITGGAGFIGSHLCLRLLKDGNHVICMDNLFTGELDHIKSCFEYDDFEYIKADVCEPYDFEVEQIYNLACPASPIHYQSDPIKTAYTCFYGAKHALELANKYNARVLQTSTSEIYGNPLIHPQKESYHGDVNPIGLRACYDEGKRFAETLFFCHHRMHNTDIRVVRIFNTYGENMSTYDGRVVSNFIMQALNDEPITVYGSGDQTRSFCYVSDTVEGLIRMMNNDSFTGPVNIGNPCEITMLKLAQTIIRLTNSNSKIIFNDLPEDDPTRRKPDITLAKEKLGWQPCVPLEQGLLKTIEYFKGKTN